jgi:hypothetical protein
LSVQGLVQLLGGNLEEVVLAESILSVTGVVLQNVLNGIVALDVQRQRLSAEEPSDTLGAGRGGKGARVLVDTVGVQVASQGREVQVVGHGKSAGGGNVIDVSEDRVEKRSGVTELGQLEDKSNNGNIGSYLLLG